MHHLTVLDERCNALLKEVTKPEESENVLKPEESERD